MKKLTIKNILVPVDFSNNSMNAIQSASVIAKQHQARIHLLHVDDYDYDLFKEDKNLKPMRMADYMKILAQLSKSIINNDQVPCTYSSETGAVTHSILKTGIDRSADLIIMGKNGTNGPSLEFAGTHTCQVSEKSRIPVIIIPDGVSKYSFENILFPVRPLLSVPQKYAAIRPFILKNKPFLTLLNLRNPDYQNELHIIHRLSLLMKERLDNDNVPHSMKYYFNDKFFAEHVISVIDQAENKYDLAVITNEVDRFNKDFHMSYYALKIIHRTSIPLLILQPEEARIDKSELLLELENQMILN